MDDDAASAVGWSPFTDATSRAFACSLVAHRRTSATGVFCARNSTIFPGCPASTQSVMAEESIRQIREEKAQRSFDVASFYESQKKWKSAKTYYEELIRNYPETPSAVIARKRVEDLAGKEAGQGKSKIWPW